MSTVVSPPAATTHTPPAHHPERRSLRPWWPWLLTALAFPPAGYLAHGVVGRVEDLPSAALAGIVTGVVLGIGQWLLLRRRDVSARWILATAGGFGVGLAVGAALVSYRTDRPSLALMGAVTGLAVGLLQATALRATARQSIAWGAATAGLFAVGWMLTSGVIDVADQWPVFGLSGALVVALLQCLFITRVLPIAAVAQPIGRHPHHGARR